MYIVQIHVFFVELRVKSRNIRRKEVVEIPNKNSRLLKYYIPSCLNRILLKNPKTNTM